MPMKVAPMDLEEALPLARSGYGRVSTALLVELDRRADEITELGNKLVTAQRRTAYLETKLEHTEGGEL